jgi:hypothetical protein
MALAAHKHTHKTASALGGDEHRQFEHFQRKKVHESFHSFPRRVGQCRDIARTANERENAAV